MAEISRRQFLTTASAIAIAAALPLPSAVAAPLPAPSATPMWAVGSPGEFNWQPIAADTIEEAIRIFAEDHDYLEEDGSFTAELDGQRCKSWDGIGKPGPADWLREGLGTYCSRCDYETFLDSGGRVVGAEAVCEDCMTIADWRIVDPEYAAEIEEPEDSRDVRSEASR